MQNIEIVKNPQFQNHLRFTLGVVVGVIFGIIIGAIASYSYVTTLASSLTSITHITKDINKLVSFSYDSNRWGRDVDKLTLLSNSNCKIYPGTEEVDLTGLTLAEQKLRMINNYQASDSVYVNVNNQPIKRIVNFDITQNFGKKAVEGINYIFHLDTTASNFTACSNEFDSVLETFNLKDVKK